MGMKIGSVAEAAGVEVSTVRYYERRGLLAEPPRMTRATVSTTRASSTGSVSSDRLRISGSCSRRSRNCWI